MRWTDLSYKCNEQSEFFEYQTTLKKASLDTNSNKYICQINQKVFSVPMWKEKNGINSKDVDCMFVDCNSSAEIPNQVLLIEFKGGKTTEDWDEGTIRYKFFDTIHCILPKLLDSNLFPTILYSQCQLIFVLAISPLNNIIKEQSDYDKIHNAKQNLKSKKKPVNITKKCEELRTLEKKLLQYSGNSPFSYIYIVDATNYSVKDPRGYYYKICL